MHVSFWVNHNDFGWDEHVSHLKMAKDCQVKYDDPDLKMFGRKKSLWNQKVTTINQDHQ